MSKKPSLYVLDDQSMYRTMVRALTALHRAKPTPEYVAITCLIMCYIDAIAAGSRKASRDRFAAFIKKEFRTLDAQLTVSLGVKSGAHTLYDLYRNGLAHNFFARDVRLAIAEDHELHGRYAGELQIGGRTLVAINVDRLYRDFVALARRRGKKKGTKKRSARTQ